MPLRLSPGATSAFKHRMREKRVKRIKRGKWTPAIPGFKEAARRTVRLEVAGIHDGAHGAEPDFLAALRGALGKSVASDCKITTCPQSLFAHEYSALAALSVLVKAIYGLSAGGGGRSRCGGCRNMANDCSANDIGSSRGWLCQWLHFPHVTLRQSVPRPVEPVP